MKKSILLVCLACGVLVGIVFAQGTPSPTPSVPGSTVPTWVFYWVLGLASFFGGVLLLIIKILWSEARKASVLTEEERTWLREVHQVRTEVPKVWTDLFDEIEESLRLCKTTLQQLVGLVEGDKADLQQQLRARLELYDKQQTKMLRLAVRVQRAVEALAGLPAPDIEPDLGDENGEDL